MKCSPLAGDVLALVVFDMMVSRKCTEFCEVTVEWATSLNPSGQRTWDAADHKTHPFHLHGHSPFVIACGWSLPIPAGQWVPQRTQLCPRPTASHGVPVIYAKLALNRTLVSREAASEGPLFFLRAFLLADRCWHRPCCQQKCKVAMTWT